MNVYFSPKTLPVNRIIFANMLIRKWCSFLNEVAFNRIIITQALFDYTKVDFGINRYRLGGIFSRSNSCGRIACILTGVLFSRCPFLGYAFLIGLSFSLASTY